MVDNFKKIKKILKKKYKTELIIKIIKRKCQDGGCFVGCNLKVDYNIIHSKLIFNKNIKTYSRIYIEAIQKNPYLI